MAIERLSRLNDWELVDKDKDLRGKTLYGPEGRSVGKVDDMLIDTDRGYVTAIRLDNGAEYSTNDFGIRDGHPVLATAGRGYERDREHVREGEREVMYLREEQLRAQRRAHQAGEVELGKRVVSEQRTMDVPVTREEVDIERRAVDRKPADRPISDTADEKIRVPVFEEGVTVEKEPVVTEEVSVGKRRIQETRQVSDTVRREEVEIDREGDIDRRR